MPQRPMDTLPPRQPARRRPPRPPKGPAAVGKAPIAPGVREPARGQGLPLPHERDESLGHVDGAPRPEIVQAKRDLDAGLVDTDLRATPGLDAERRDQLLATPAGAPTPPTPKPRSKTDAQRR